MNTTLCQHCGALLRRSRSSKCSACGNIVTEFSSTGILKISTASSPCAVAVANDPLAAEKMICQLHHATLATKNLPVGADISGTSSLLSPSVGAYLTGLTESLNGPLSNNQAAAETAQVLEISPSQQKQERDDSSDAILISSAIVATGAAAALSYMAGRASSEGNGIAEENLPDREGRPVASPLQDQKAAELAAAKPYVLPGDFFAEVPPLAAPSHAAPQHAISPLAFEQGIEEFDHNVESGTRADSGVLRPSAKLQQALPTVAAKIRSAESDDRMTDERKEELIQRLIDANSTGKLAPAQSEFYSENELSKKQPATEKKSRRRFDGSQKSDDNKDDKQEHFVFVLPKKFLVVVIAFVSVAALIYFVSNQINSLPASPNVNVPGSIGGTYSYVYKTRIGTDGAGNFSLQQSGNHITGEGKDIERGTGLSNSKNNFKRFKVDGSYLAPNLHLTKRYLSQSGLTVGAAIVYEGNAITSMNAQAQKRTPILQGLWYFEPKTGANPALLSASLKMPWKAEFLAPVSGSASSSNWFSDLFWNESEPVASRFIKILLGCIIFGIGLVQVSVKFFGMHGLLNIWEREKYIPHQIKGKHQKLLSELAKGRKTGALHLGTRFEWTPLQFWMPKELFVPAQKRDRNPHVLALGAGAKGKSRLLASMIVDDIRSNDRAVVVVDSDGSLVELILRWLGSDSEASKRLKRVSLIDPCRSECTLGFDPLCKDNADNLQAIASSIAMGFKSVYTESQNQQNQWTQQTANILRNSVLLLMLNDRKLADLPVLLSDNDFRDVLLEKVEKTMASEWATLIDAWSNYKRLARTEQWINWIEPILNRVQPLLSDKRISRLLNTQEQGVDLLQLLEEKRILLVRVPEGQLEKGGSLLGSLIVTGLRQAGLSHFERTGDSGKSCSLYLDEMNNFIDAEAFEALCSDARKVRIGIHGALKSLQDLPEDYRNRVQVNFGGMALFALSKKDADLIGPSMFRVDGRKPRKWTFRDFFNPVNSTPTLDMATDEEKINVNRLVGQDEQSYFFHLTGTEAGVFRVKAPEFKDIARGDVNWDLVDSLYEEQDYREEDED